MIVPCPLLAQNPQAPALPVIVPYPVSPPPFVAIPGLKATKKHEMLGPVVASIYFWRKQPLLIAGAE
jgi:hypothetical protein